MIESVTVEVPEGNTYTETSIRSRIIPHLQQLPHTAFRELQVVNDRKFVFRFTGIREFVVFVLEQHYGLKEVSE